MPGYPTVPYWGGSNNGTYGGGGSSGGSTGLLSSSGGQQPGGNNYPAGIYGVGANGSGTAVGTLQPEDLTSEWLNKINDPTNPYIHQAMQRAGQQANSRGLVNSSIAAGNAQGAAIQASLPIAQSNAQAALGLQTTNLDNLAKIRQANMAAKAQTMSAGIAAQASMFGSRAGMYDTQANNAGALLRQTDLLAYQGQQADLNYQRSLGLQNNEGQIGMYNSMFNLGGNLLMQQGQFTNQLGIAALSDPAILGDPNALMGFNNLINGTSQSYVDSLFNSIFGSFQMPTSPNSGGGG